MAWSRRSSLVESGDRSAELGLLVGLYVAHRRSADARLPPDAHPPRVRVIEGVPGDHRRARRDGGRGLGHTWVADHRKHHAFTDQEGDPHSPHLSGPGFLGAVKGLWHAHVGWLFETVGAAERERFAPDLVKDRMMGVIDRLFLVWVALSFVVPFGLGWAIGGTVGAALSALLWGGLVRVFLLHHVTWSINSVCHFFGRRRFEVEDESRNVFWLAPLSMGEAWHHTHHAFPTSAFHGLRFWERIADPTGLVISLLERVGLVWNVVRISPERQAAKSWPVQP